MRRTVFCGAIAFCDLLTDGHGCWKERHECACDREVGGRLSLQGSFHVCLPEGPSHQAGCQLF